MDEIENINENYGESDNTGFSRSVLIITICLALMGVYAIYSVFTADIQWGFKINWNCFESPLFTVFSVIGFFLQFFNWQHMSFETWIGTKKSNGDTKWEKSGDIMDSLFGGCVWPLLSHLLIVPCMYGAAIWYAVMGLVHILGKMSPFFISLLIIGLVFLFYKLAISLIENKYRVALLAGLALIATGIIGGTAYYLSNTDFTFSINDKIPDTLGICEITGNQVNLRQGPGTEYDKLGITVSSGESYPLMEESGDWVRIDYNGTPAWLSNKFCALTYSSTQGVDDEDPGCSTGEDEESGESYLIEEVASKPNPTEKTENSVTEIPDEILNTVQVTQIQTVGEESSSASADEEIRITSHANDNEIYNNVDVAAEFSGGMQALMSWLSKNIRYPEAAQQANIQGRPVVKFVIEKDGSVTQAQIIKGADRDLDKEALRVVNNMPKWTPAKKNGQPIRSYYTLPITFRLK